MSVWPRVNQKHDDITAKLLEIEALENEYEQLCNEEQGLDNQVLSCVIYY
jgi:hypothetical protein